jgi:flagellin
MTGALDWTDISDSANAQVLSLSSTDVNGGVHTLAVSLDDTTGADIGTAVKNINAELQKSNDADLQNIVAVVDNKDNTKVRFISTNESFQVSLGVSVGAEGLDNGAQGVIVESTLDTNGGNASIATEQLASQAVDSLAKAVASLGAAQAVVGKGQNRFNYAVSLASTQLTNLAASESRIRDADLALEAANLTKAQILQQAGIAALAQANSAPQAVLSLLRG